LILAVLGVILLFLILFFPSMKSNFGGTFIAKDIPIEYQNNSQFFNDQQQFFRVAWLPKFSRYSDYSSLHPRLNLSDIIYRTWNKVVDNPDEVYQFLATPVAKNIYVTSSFNSLGGLRMRKE